MFNRTVAEMRRRASEDPDSYYYILSGDILHNNNNNNSILLHNLKNYGPLLWAEYVSLLKCPDLKII